MSYETIFIILFTIILFFLITFLFNSKKDEKIIEENIENKIVDEKLEEEFNYYFQTYLSYIKSNPLSYEEIRDASKLPFKKEEFLKKSLDYISYADENTQHSLLSLLPELAYFRDDLPDNRYNFNIKNDIDEEVLSLSNKGSKIKRKKKNLDIFFNKLRENNGFTNDLYTKCNDEFELILSTLKVSLYSQNKFIG